MSEISAARTDLATAIVSKAFPTSPFGQRYNTDDVDDKLDVIVAAIRHGDSVADLLTQVSELCLVRAGFFGTGYEANAVDDYLTELAAAIRKLG